MQDFRKHPQCLQATQVMIKLILPVVLVTEFSRQFEVSLMRLVRLDAGFPEASTMSAGISPE
jgi:hypothetical protein